MASRFLVQLLGYRIPHARIEEVRTLLLDQLLPLVREEGPDEVDQVGLLHGVQVLLHCRS